MIDLTAYQGKTMAVLGLGKSGIATVRALVAAGAMVWAWDDNEKARRELFQFGLAPLDLAHADWSEIDALVISPGIPNLHPAPHPVAAAARTAGVPLICDVALLARAQGSSRFIAVTGTNGKSTTTALLAHILDRAGQSIAVGGNLGTPVLDLAPLDATGTYVLELSSYQIELLGETRIDAGALLNITPDHLDRHGGFEGYVAAKRALFDHLGEDSPAVICIDDTRTETMAAELARAGNCRIVPVSAKTYVSGGAFIRDGVLMDSMETVGTEIVDLNGLERLRGAHNHQNIAVAYVMAKLNGVTRQAFIAGLTSYPGLAHRQELVAAENGVTFINDSKATNAEAAAKALGAYDRIHWILGGLAKETGLDGLEPYFSKIEHAYLIGEAEADFARRLAAANVSHERCGTLDRAVVVAARRAQTGAPATVLLSPACASWDQFASFEARGDAFRAAVRSHLGQGESE